MTSYLPTPGGSLDFWTITSLAAACLLTFRLSFSLPPPLCFGDPHCSFPLNPFSTSPTLWLALLLSSVFTGFGVFHYLTGMLVACTLGLWVRMVTAHCPTHPHSNQWSVFQSHRKNSSCLLFPLCLFPGLHSFTTPHSFLAHLNGWLWQPTCLPEPGT